MGAADFRVGGRIFATLASQDLGYGNLMLDGERQAALLDARPDLYLPVPGGWGRMGATHIRLGVTDEAELTRAIQIAWQLRIDKNNSQKKRTPRKKTR